MQLRPFGRAEPYLRYAEEERNDPRDGNNRVGLGRRPGAVGQRVADNLASYNMASIKC